MKIVLLTITSTVLAIGLLVQFNAPQGSIERHDNVSHSEPIEDTIPIDVTVVKSSSEEEYIDLSALTFDVVEANTLTQETDGINHDQEEQNESGKYIWTRASSEISTNELSSAETAINELIYNIYLAIELEGSYQPPGGRKMLAGDMQVTQQICGLGNNSFNIDHEFETISTQHYCFDVFRNLMSDSIEYKDSKDTLKKIEQEMFALLDPSV